MDRGNQTELYFDRWAFFFSPVFTVHFILKAEVEKGRQKCHSNSTKMAWCLLL